MRGLADVRLKDRLYGFLGLKEERIAVIPAQQ